MSFNVRFPSPGDGPDVWDKRRDFLVATIRKHAPDVFGTQELFHEQGEYIVAQAPEYRWFGLSRRGNQTDEHMGVFYKHAKLKLTNSGNFWLSENPNQPGSMSWNVSLPRMATWGLFETASGFRFYLVNTHFPHRREDEAARVECARVIARYIDGRPAIPIVLTGDFNAPAGGAVYNVFQLTDAWKSAAKRSGPEGTFNGFRGTTTGPRIDWILFRGPLRVMEAHTITDDRQGRYPSDHFPVMAVFDYQ
ncbi:MAG: endonuclease/exonuclease/phosphatase family protein [Bryobacteraceae bacterium]